MLETDQTPRPIAPGPPPVDGMAAGGDSFRATIGREAFRGMVIWEIPVHTEPQTGTLKKGYEAQVCDTYPDKRKTGSLVDVRDLDASPVKDGEWFEFGIAVNGKRITVTVNGAPVVEYEEPPSPERKKGRERRLLSHGQIALQAHDPKSMVLYKNIRIRLPDGK